MSLTHFLNPDLAQFAELTLSVDDASQTEIRPNVVNSIGKT
jgi:DNA-binding MurR/RpiR family transcriptional regulator